MVAIDGCKDELDTSEIFNPFDKLQEEDFKQGLVEKISSLPEREKMIMSLYYDDEFNLREIGEILGITEGRVCQIHSQALLRLRARMTDWINDNSK
jgi:RNA polymerase sigma factor for flagellar operon FliA